MTTTRVQYTGGRFAASQPIARISPKSGQDSGKPAAGHQASGQETNVSPRRSVRTLCASIHNIPRYDKLVRGI